MSRARARRDEWAAAAAAIRAAVDPHVKAIAGLARAAEAAQRQTTAQWQTTAQQAVQQSQTPPQTPPPPNGHGHYTFAGIDASPAPSKSTESMCRVVELLGVDHFGASGTIECCAFLTRIFKSIGGGDCPLVGFSGLMFAPLEDSGLAAAAGKRQYGIGDLLVYSTCCGIGLDTVPIPGDTPPEKMAQLARDCGTLAFRLNKPLTVRLFPCEGMKAGDTTAFESDDLCNCRVFEVP